MADESLRKGLESLVAEGLRRHVLETVLARPEVVRNLSPEALARLRERILARLLESEESGREHRETALAAIRGLRAAAGPLGDLVASTWKVLQEMAPTAGASRPEDPVDDEAAAGETSGSGEKP